ncbi:hypothetical protein B0H16DRAFT_995462 [Mycena metata]|uniref:Uncharacterized protein n=1 Tax=Mycena metata TaxID=1033252 RepID=A0AAD7IIY8_9AGAR|nr:hypothetical protein B0H16DRAFT_995462 [Mycena metata]
MFHVAHCNSEPSQWQKQSTSDTDAVVIHDNEWIDLLNEDQETVPDDAELVKRFFNQYQIVHSSSGVVHLQDTEEDIDEFLSMGTHLFRDRPRWYCLELSLILTCWGLSCLDFWTESNYAAKGWLTSLHYGALWFGYVVGYLRLLISPILGNTVCYIFLALVLTAFTAYGVNLYNPSRRLARLEDAINAAEDNLTHAMENCPKDYLELMDLMDSLFQAKISTSNIRIQLLAASGLAKWSLKITKRINECTKKVKKINTTALYIMEGEHQYQLTKSSKEKLEVINAITLPPTRHAQERVFRVRRRFAPSPATTP